MIPAYTPPVKLGAVSYHPRSHWVDDAKPITGPVWVPRLIDTAVAHYTAAVDLPDGDADEHQTDRDIGPYLRSIQADYLRSRGYSIGYWYAVDWLGGIWQLRGFDLVTGLDGLKSAANYGHNDHTAPVLFLVDGNDAPTELAAAAFRYIAAAVRTHPWRGRRTPLSVIDHGRLPIPPGHSTSCAGTGIRRAIDAGELTERIAPPTPPTPPPTREDHDMSANNVCTNAEPRDGYGPRVIKWIIGDDDGSLRYVPRAEGVARGIANAEAGTPTSNADLDELDAPAPT